MQISTIIILSILFIVLIFISYVIRINTAATKSREDLRTEPSLVESDFDNPIPRYRSIGPSSSNYGSSSYNASLNDLTCVVVCSS